MRRNHLLLSAAALAVFIAGLRLGKQPTVAQSKEKPGYGFASMPGQVGGQDTFGPYDVVKDWPKNIASIPGNSGWTWGAGESVFAESPNRVFLLMRGELPNTRRPQTKLLPEF